MSEKGGGGRGMQELATDGSRRSGDTVKMKKKVIKMSLI